VLALTALTVTQTQHRPNPNRKKDMMKTQTENLLPTPSLAGYTPGIAPWLTVSTVAIDQRVASRLRCPEDGSRLVYTPYFRLIPRSYRARAVCSCCRHSEEI